MDAELQPERVDPLRERTEPPAVAGAREPDRVGDEAPVLIQLERSVFVVAMGARGGIRPVDVDDHRVPAELEEVRGHELGVRHALRPR